MQFLNNRYVDFNKPEEKYKPQPTKHKTCDCPVSDSKRINTREEYSDGLTICYMCKCGSYWERFIEG